jgi:hypothetical protein
LVALELVPWHDREHGHRRVASPTTPLRSLVFAGSAILRDAIVTQYAALVLVSSVLVVLAGWLGVLLWVALPVAPSVVFASACIVVAVLGRRRRATAGGQGPGEQAHGSHVIRRQTLTLPLMLVAPRGWRNKRRAGRAFDRSSRPTLTSV